MSDPQEPTAPQSPQAEPQEGGGTPRPKRRRGSRGGRNRNRTTARQPAELPERPTEGRPQTVEAADRALVRKPDPNAPKPQIGDSRPAPVAAEQAADGDKAPTPARRRRRRGGRGRSGSGG